MIKLIVGQRKSQVVSFSMEGHAEYADYGSDIVCSAASALTISAVNGLYKFSDAKLEVDQKNGYLSCAIQNYDDLSEKDKACVMGILNTMVLGVESIKDQYPETIYVEYIEV